LRARAALVVERSREKQRMEKLLEDAGIKLSVFVSDMFGVSGRAMLTALVDGERDPQVLAGFAQGRMPPKIPVLVEALTGRLGEHHAFLCRVMLRHIDDSSSSAGGSAHWWSCWSCRSFRWIGGDDAAPRPNRRTRQ
jgi:transposase